MKRSRRERPLHLLPQEAQHIFPLLGRDTGENPVYGPGDDVIHRGITGLCLVPHFSLDFETFSLRFCIEAPIRTRNKRKIKEEQYFWMESETSNENNRRVFGIFTLQKTKMRARMPQRLL